MKNTPAAIRYAKSLFDLSIEKSIIDRVYQDTQLIHTALKEKDLNLLIHSPIVKADKKISIFKEIFSSHIDSLTLSFINLLATKRREGILKEILVAYQGLYNQHKNIAKAVVITASGLDDTLRKKVYEQIKKSTNSEIELVEEVNKDIIGGFILKMGTNQYDSSVLRSLRNLKTQLQ